MAWANRQLNILPGQLEEASIGMCGNVYLKVILLSREEFWVGAPLHFSYWISFLTDLSLSRNNAFNYLLVYIKIYK